MPTSIPRTSRSRRRLLAGSLGVGALALMSVACQGPTASHEVVATLRCQTYWGGDMVTEAGEHDITVAVTAPAWSDAGDQVTLRVDGVSGYFGEPGTPYAIDLDLSSSGLDPAPSHLDVDDPATGDPLSDATITARVSGPAGTDATVDVDTVRFKKVGQWETARTICFPRTGETARLVTIPIRSRRSS